MSVEDVSLAISLGMFFVALALLVPFAWLNWRHRQWRRRTRVLILLSFGVGGAYHNAHAQAFPPVRPTGQDLSWRHRGELRFYRGHVANQTERDALVQGLLMRVPELMRYARANPSCAANVGTATGFLSEIETRFNVVNPYDDVLGPPRKTWFISTQGANNLYDRPLSILQRMSYCSTAGASAQANCAKSKLLTADLADLLDVRVVDGKCVWPAAFQSPVNPPYTTVGEKVGIVDGRLGMPPRVGSVALSATHHAHMCVSDRRCDGTYDFGRCANVLAAHIAYEAGATNANEQHFRRMKDFDGYADSVRTGNLKGWTAAQECKWGRVQDKFHGEWLKAQESGDWGFARQAETAHQAAHLCLNIRAPFKIRMPCGRPMTYCPILTCEQYLAGFGQ